MQGCRYFLVSDLPFLTSGHRFQVKGTDSLDDCAEFGIALVGQHLVQAFAGYASIERDLHHAASWARGTDALDPFARRGGLTKVYVF